MAEPFPSHDELKQRARWGKERIVRGPDQHEAFHRVLVEEVQALDGRVSDAAESLLLASVNFQQVITADVASAPVVFATVPESGPYLCTIYVEVITTTAATGAINADVRNAGAPMASAGFPITAANGIQDFTFQAILPGDLDIEYDFQVTGFTTGSATIKLVASVITRF